MLKTSQCFRRCLWFGNQTVHLRVVGRGRRGNVGRNWCIIADFWFAFLAQVLQADSFQCKTWSTPRRWASADISGLLFSVWHKDKEGRGLKLKIWWWCSSTGLEIQRRRCLVVIVCVWRCFASWYHGRILEQLFAGCCSRCSVSHFHLKSLAFAFWLFSLEKCRFCLERSYLWM